MGERLLPELIQVLQQLGTQVEVEETASGIAVQRIYLECQGWPRENFQVQVPVGSSSQFASAILLSAWGLENPLLLCWQGSLVSEPYLQMAQMILQDLGMKLETSVRGMRVLPSPQLTRKSYVAEADMSTAFAFAAAGVVMGPLDLPALATSGLQSDEIFVELLQQMGVTLNRHETGVRVQRAGRLKGLKVFL